MGNIPPPAPPAPPPKKKNYEYQGSPKRPAAGRPRRETDDEEREPGLKICLMPLFLPGQPPRMAAGHSSCGSTSEVICQNFSEILRERDRYGLHPSA